MFGIKLLKEKIWYLEHETKRLEEELRSLNKTVDKMDIYDYTHIKFPEKISNQDVWNRLELLLKHLNLNINKIHSHEELKSKGGPEKP